MRFLTWTTNRQTRKSLTRNAADRRRPLRHEHLEDRRLLTTFVNGLDAMSDAGGCGTFANPCNTIQGGVDNAPAGGEVYVVGGTYAENVTITKSLRLRGEAGAVTIDPPGGLDGIDITGFHTVTLENLTVKGSRIGVFASGLASLELQEMVVKDNLSDGLTVMNSASARIIGGRFTGNRFNGITLASVDMVTLLNGVVVTTNLEDGIDISSANQVQIAGGTFNSNGLDGMRIATNTGTGSELSISGVTGGMNGQDGLDIRAWSGQTTVQDAEFHSNTSDGIRIDDVGAVALERVSANLNTRSGIQVSGATQLLDTDGEYNGNADHGLDLADISGTATLHRTVGNDNDRDFDLIGSGLYVHPDATMIGAGSLSLLGTGFHDSDGAAIGTNQVYGVIAQDVPGETAIVNSFHNLFSAAASGNYADGIFLDGGGPVRIAGGIFNSNRSAGIRVLGHTSADLTGVESKLNLAHGLSAFGTPDIWINGGTFDSNLGHGMNIESAAMVTIDDAGGFSANSNTIDGLNVTGSGMVQIRGGQFNMNASDGIRLTAVGDARFSETVTAIGNTTGVHLTNVMGFSDIGGVYMSNDDHGLLLENIQGQVFLQRTTANNNDRDADGLGDGLHARSTVPGPPAIGGGGLQVRGGSFRDTDGPLAGSHQQHGIFVSSTPMAFLVPDGDSGGVVTATGNAVDGLRLGGGTFATIVAGNYSSNRGDGIDLSGINGQIEIAQVTADGNSGDGLKIATSGTVRVGFSNFDQNLAHGIELDQVGNVEVLNVAATLNQFDGFNVSVAFDVAVTGSDFSDNVDNGIETFLTSDVSVTDTAANGSGTLVTPGSSGMKFSSAPTLTLTGITVIGSTLHGVQIGAVPVVAWNAGEGQHVDLVVVDSSTISHVRDSVALDDVVYDGVGTLNLGTQGSDDSITIQFGGLLPMIELVGGEQGYSDILTVVRSTPVENITVTATQVTNGVSIIQYSEIEKVVVDEGDFNFDRGLGLSDIDAIVAEIASGNNSPAFELTGDRYVNLEDLDRWLALAGAMNLPSGNPYILGDANLDGVTDGSDFNLWNANKFSSGRGWSGGDFNADGVTDGSDFNIWNSHKFQSSLRASAGPSPSPKRQRLGLSWIAPRSHVTGS